MVSQVLHEVVTNAPHVLALALALGVMIGATGTAVEAVGMFAQRFARTTAIGAVLVHFGKLLEGYGTDIPKIVTNATGWVTQFAKLFGTAAIFLLAFGSLVLATSPSGCSAAQTKVEAENVAIVAGCKVSESLVPDGGEAGAADDLASIKAGCTTALRVWDHAK